MFQHLQKKGSVLWNQLSNRLISSTSRNVPRMPNENLKPRKATDLCGDDKSLENEPHNKKCESKPLDETSDVQHDKNGPYTTQTTSLAAIKSAEEASTPKIRQGKSDAPNSSSRKRKAETIDVIEVDVAQDKRQQESTSAKGRTKSLHSRHLVRYSRRD